MLQNTRKAQHDFVGRRLPLFQLPGMTTPMTNLMESPRSYLLMMLLILLSLSTTVFYGLNSLSSSSLSSSLSSSINSSGSSDRIPKQSSILESSIPSNLYRHFFTMHDDYPFVINTTTTRSNLSPQEKSLPLLIQQGTSQSVTTTTTTTVLPSSLSLSMVPSPPQQQHHHQLQHLQLLRYHVEQMAKSLIAIEEWVEECILSTFRMMTHPIVLLDIVIFVLWANVVTVWGGATASSGLTLFRATKTTSGSVLGRVVRMTQSAQQQQQQQRSWFLMLSRVFTGSARRWTRLVRLIVQQRRWWLRSNTWSKALGRSLIPNIRNLVKSFRRIVYALWEHRSRYSLLSDYAWYVNTGGGENSTTTTMDGPIQTTAALSTSSPSR